MALITGTDFITIATTDIDRAVEFYGEVLGLEKARRGCSCATSPS